MGCERRHDQATAAPGKHAKSWKLLSQSCLQMYGLAEEALVGVQQELEARLKPPQELQDGLYAAKDSLPVPSDPIRNALDAFAKKALGDIGRHLPPLLSQCGFSCLSIQPLQHVRHGHLSSALQGRLADEYSMFW